MVKILDFAFIFDDVHASRLNTVSCRRSAYLRRIEGGSRRFDFFMNPDLEVSMWLELNARIIYEAEKNAHYKQLSAAEVLVHLRQHLTALRMSHPKADNVRPVTGDGIRFFWHTQMNSVRCPRRSS